MSDKKSANKHFENFLTMIEQNENEESNKEIVKNKEIIEKENILIPIAEFLIKVREAGILVNSYKYLFMSPTEQNHAEPEEFAFYKKESENSIAYDIIHPSPLIIINDPAPIEIGVINESYRDSDGLIRITCANSHPDSLIIKGNYKSSEEALSAITVFLGKNAVAKKRKTY